MAEGQITGNEVIKDDVFERLERFSKMLDDIILKFDSAEKKGRSASNSISFADAEKENTEAVNKSKKALTEYERIQRQLEKQEEKRVAAQTRLARRLAEQRVETQRLNRETRRNSIVNNENERVYKRLSAQYAKQKDDLKDLVLLYGENSREVREFAREVERTGQKIKTADNIAGDFQRNVGNYPSALRPAITAIKQFVGAFGIIEGVRFVARLVTDMTRLAREAKGVEFAFQRIGREGQESFENIRNQTRGLFSDLEIKQAIVEFDNFRLSGEQLGTIFEFIAVRAAQTGQSFEYLRNSAIEAITKESVLRADNLGISQKALNDEIAKGADFLTAFGNVAEREIERAGDILDEAGNSAQKFDASIDNIKLGFGEIFTQFKGFSLVNGFFNGLSDSVQLTNAYLNDQITYVESLKATYRAFTESGRAENRRILEEISARQQLNKELEAQASAYEKLNGVATGPLQQGQENKVNFLTGPGNTEAVRTLADINAEIEKYRDILEATDTADKQRLKSIAEKINSLNREKDAILDLLETEKQSLKSKEEFVRTYDLATEEGLTSAITLLESQQKKLVLGSDEWVELGKQADNYRKILKKVKDEANFSIEDIAFIDSDAAQDALDVKNFLDTEGIEFQAGLLAQRLGQNQADLIEEFKSLYEQDFENFQDYAKRKLETEDLITQQRVQNQLDFLSTTQDFAQAFFDIQSNRIDDEIEKQNEAFDNIINNKNSSEEAIAIAEKKRDENEKRLEKEREKRQRRAFLIQQGIEIAKVWIQAAAASAAALAPPPVGLGPVFGAALIPGININAGLAIGAILAQSIPQFFKGKSAADNYEGIASVNELPGQREYRVNKDGVIEMLPSGMHYTYVKGDDIIEKSKSSLQSSLRDKNSEVFKRVVANKYSNDTNERTKVIKLQSEGNYNEALLEKAMVRALKKSKFNVNVTNRFPKPRRKYFSA